MSSKLALIVFVFVGVVNLVGWGLMFQNALAATAEGKQSFVRIKEHADALAAAPTDKQLKSGLMAGYESEALLNQISMNQGLYWDNFILFALWMLNFSAFCWVGRYAVKPAPKPAAEHSLPAVA